MVSITHNFTSAKADDPAAASAGKILPSHWNDSHAIAMAATARVVGRKTSGAGAAEECTLSEILDFIGSAAQGDILYRGASAWARLAAGTAGQVLVTGGAGANPAWGDSGVPSGSVFPFAGASAPTGYLLCYGQAVSRTTYAALFAALGTAFGAGDGSTTFNVPDLRGRAPFGEDDMGGSAASRLTSAKSGIDGATVGASGGAESKTLTTTELPAHTHTASSGTESATHTHSGTTASDGAHTHNIREGGGAGGTDIDFSIGSSLGATNTQAVQSGGAHTHTFTTGNASATHTHTITVDSAGTGAEFGNMPPALVLKYIIKI